MNESKTETAVLLAIALFVIGVIAVSVIIFGMSLNEFFVAVREYNNGN